MSLKSFLNKQTQVALPSSEDFAPSGFVGAWFAQVLFGFYSTEDLAQIEDAPQVDGRPYHARRKMGQGFRYYFKTKEHANAAGALVGMELNPQESWTWQCKRDKVLNFANAETLNKFSDVIVFDTRITSLKSKKYRHELHMLALPMAVASYATALGYDNPGFDVSELLGKDVLFTDEFQARMIGNENGYAESLLWQRRADLWRALGEEDATVYDPNKTKANKLQECLYVLSAEWKSTVWARLITVPDPRVDATYGDENKRLTIPGVVQFFESEKEARATAEIDIARAKASKEAKANGNGHSTNGHSALAIPDAWSDIPQDWNALVAQLKNEFSGKPQPLIKKQLAARASEYAATADELYAWVTAEAF